jgi:transcriptional regulator with XRE-family HTH domain
VTSQGANDPTTILGRNIKAARESKDLTQKELGLLIGVDALAVSRWERGVGTPNGPNLQAVAQHLQVEIGWLYTDHDAVPA